MCLACKGDFSVEIKRWILKVGDNPIHQIIPGLQSALKLADKDLCHTIFKLLIVNTLYIFCIYIRFNKNGHNTNVGGPNISNILVCYTM